MIDLHMHTINSDGTDTTLEILKKCENLNLEYISITDHDTCEAYNDLKGIDIKNIFKGRIITGCEFTTIYRGRTIEILGYFIEPDIINEWLNSFYNKQSMKNYRDDCINQALKKLKNIGIKINKEELDKDCSYDRAIYKLLLLNKEENEKIIGQGILDNLTTLFRNGFANPESLIYVDVGKYRPTPKQITDLIHKAGGLAFLAHPYQYYFENILDMITLLRKDCDLDGVEAFHSTFTVEQTLILQEYAKKNKLYISGGSDYHGKRRPEISLKTGNDNLHISKNILEWLKE